MNSSICAAGESHPSPIFASGKDIRQAETLLTENDCEFALRDDHRMARNIRSRRARAVIVTEGAEERLYLAEWLRAVDIRPAKLAAATEINEGYLSQLRNGKKTNPGRDVLKAIAAELGIDWKLLYEPPPNQSALDQLRKYGSAVIERLGREPKR